MLAAQALPARRCHPNHPGHLGRFAGRADPSRAAPDPHALAARHRGNARCFCNRGSAGSLDFGHNLLREGRVTTAALRPAAKVIDDDTGPFRREQQSGFPADSAPGPSDHGNLS
jgi:hypothetical protein